jgi:hypothetical protein
MASGSFSGTDTETKKDSINDGVSEKGPGVVAASEAVQDDSIDADNEITGPRLLLIHMAFCLCIFLSGLVWFWSS